MINESFTTSANYISVGKFILSLVVLYLDYYIIYKYCKILILHQVGTTYVSVYRVRSLYLLTHIMIATVAGCDTLILERKTDLF